KGADCGRHAGRLAKSMPAAADAPAEVFGRFAALDGRCDSRQDAAGKPALDPAVRPSLPLLREPAP
ncbi:MAG: hypothetical protein ACK595_11860, partial [Planctomycetota bacterium]